MEDLIVNLKEGARIIKFNRPKKRNAITQKMYVEMAKILNEDAVNDDVVVTIISGTGNYYSSGNDFKSEMTDSSYSMENVSKYIEALINYPKLLVAIVNGPAIGIAATTTTLFDIVYATENAWFQTPFLKLALCPEGCSSYTFPRILGRSRASEMLFLNKIMTAEEAHKCGFVSKVVSFNSLHNLIEEVSKFGKLPLESVKVTKKLILDNIKGTLCECNKREIEQLDIIINSEQFADTIMKMMTAKSKL